MQIREEADCHPEFGKQVEESMKQQLSSSNLNSNKNKALSKGTVTYGNRIRRKLSESREIDSEISSTSFIAENNEVTEIISSLDLNHPEVSPRTLLMKEPIRSKSDVSLTMRSSFLDKSLDVTSSSKGDVNTVVLEQKKKSSFLQYDIDLINVTNNNEKELSLMNISSDIDDFTLNNSNLKVKPLIVKDLVIISNNSDIVPIDMIIPDQSSSVNKEVGIIPSKKPRSVKSARFDTSFNETQSFSDSKAKEVVLFIPEKKMANHIEVLNKENLSNVNKLSVTDYNQLVVTSDQKEDSDEEEDKKEQISILREHATVLENLGEEAIIL